MVITFFGGFLITIVVGVVIGVLAAIFRVKEASLESFYTAAGVLSFPVGFVLLNWGGVVNIITTMHFSDLLRLLHLSFL